MAWGTITSPHSSTSVQHGGDIMNKIAKLFSDIDISQTPYDSSDIPIINTPFQFKSGKLKIGDPDNDNWIGITSDDQTDDFTLKIPTLEDNDTMATLGNYNIFTNGGEFHSSGGTDEVLEIVNPIKTVGKQAGFNFDLYNSNDQIQNYGSIYCGIDANTVGAVSAYFTFWVRQAGTGRQVLTITKDGLLQCGGINRRLEFDETGQTSKHTFTFPNANALVAGQNFANFFTATQEVSLDDDTTLALTRPINTANAEWGVEFWAKNSTPASQQYGEINARIVTNTTGAEDGALVLSVIKGGTLTNTMKLLETGDFLFGANLRGKFKEANLTTARAFDLPNADTVLMGAAGQSGATVDINNSSGENDMLNYSVPANAMGANGCVRFTISGYILQNQASGTTYTFRIKFGTTIMWADVSASLAQSATKMPFRFTGEIFNKNATNAQGCSAFIVINDTLATATTGLGDIQDDEVQTAAPVDSEGADTTKDTTSAQTLQVTVQMSVQNSAAHTVVKHKMVEVITG